MLTSKAKINLSGLMETITGAAEGPARRLLTSEPARHITFLVILISIAFGAMTCLWASTPAGLGIGDDSVAYIGAARNMLAGNGYSRTSGGGEIKPVTHYPPLLSLALATGSALIHYDPVRVARGLLIFLWGLSAFLGGWWAWRLSGSMIAGLLFAFFLAADGKLLLMHAEVMSEPLFIALTFIAFLLLGHYFAKGAWPWLLAAGAISGLAYLTRYSGLALLACFAFALFIIEPGWKKIRSLLIYLAGALPFIIAWTLYNTIRGISATNRVLIYHAIPPEKVNSAFRQVWDWLVPAWFANSAAHWPVLSILKASGDGPKLPYLAVGTLGLVLLVWLVVAVVQLWSRGVQNPQRASFFASTSYAFIYLASILFSMAFFDASTPFADRILAPIYIALLAAFIMFGVWLWRKHSRRLQVLVIIWLLGASALSLTNASRAVRYLQTQPLGFASWRWRHSETIALIKALPPDTFLYSNEPEAVYFLTNRGARIMPKPIDPVRGQPRSGFDAEVTLMRAKLLEGKTVLVIFHPADMDQDLLAKLTEGIPPYSTTSDGLILGVP